VRLQKKNEVRMRFQSHVSPSCSIPCSGLGLQSHSLPYEDLRPPATAMQS